MNKPVLAIETSCDDTSVAIVSSSGEVLALTSAHQDAEHAPYGGIVPEIAGRNHSIHLLPLIDAIMVQAKVSFKDLSGIVVTNRPGLIGSLIVGVVTAKSLAQSHSLPVLGVNHLEGHILAPFLRDTQYSPSFSYEQPFIALAISGGHTSLYHVKGLGQYEILGSTLDDAAGEAFDKFAKMLGLGFPGGVQVDKLAQQGSVTAFELPRSMIKEDNYMMSFSGLKSSGQRLIQSLSAEEVQSRKADLCASFQEAIVDVLIAKLDRAVKNKRINRVVITGGVSANSRLRARGEEWAKKSGVQLLIPPLRYCTDNAAMIGFAGALRLAKGEQDAMSMGPSPASREGDFIL